MAWELDESQREAVESTDRAIMVVAGPGTGKTRVLTSRALWLTEELAVDPSRILAITYTNRAAAEMRSRLASGARKDASEIPVYTFHAWAYRQVRKHAEVLGFEHEPIVFDEQSTEQLLIRLLGQKRIPEEILPIRFLKQLLDRAKSQITCPIYDKRISPEIREEATDLLRSYQEELRARGALDFSDILLSALQLLICHPEIRERISGGIEHLLIDEFQDINTAQYQIVETLASPAMSLFAVGDEDQTIYAFRGSSGEFIDRFVADFNARLVPLGGSYRCSKAMLFAAGTVIAKNRRYYLQPPKPPTDLKENPPVTVFEIEDEEEEASVVSKLIKTWVDRDSVPYREIAILYRIHNIAVETERLLLERGIPTVRLTPDRQRKELVGDPIPMLRLALTDTEWDWDRALGLPRDRLGELDDLRVRLIALHENTSIPTLLGRASRFKHLSPLARHQLARLNDFVRALRKEAKTQAPSMLLNMTSRHLDSTRSPFKPHEDAWLAEEESSLAGFDLHSPAALLEEWQASSDGIRIFHAPTVSALLAGRLLGLACEEILSVKAQTVPLPFEIESSISIPRDTRPVVFIGLNHPPDLFFPPDYLFHRAIYVNPTGVSDSAPPEPATEDSFPLALSAHRLAAELVAYHPGGAPDEEIVFFDLETTGTDIFRDEIVELAAIKAHLRDGRAHELGHFHSLVNPGFKIPADASAVHGIKDKDVADAPTIKSILPGFLEFVGNSPLAGHNVDSYDLPILRRVAGKHLSMVVPNLSLDTLPLSRRLFPGESHTLGALAKRLGVEGDQGHRALSDVRANIGVFTKLIEIDESMRARSFSPAVPIALAVAHAMDDNAEQDPTWLRQAAARAIWPFALDPMNFPFIKSVSENLTPHARKHVESIVDKLTRVPLEPDEAEHFLRTRIEFLQEEAVRLEKDRFDLGLPEFLAHIALLTEGDFESDENAVKMMSLHAAKGLEFDRVILLGLEHGNLPHRFALNKGMSEIEEERRLFYVGLTRARQRAALVYARRRFGRWRPPSMFIGELPARAVRRYRTKDRVSGK